VLFHSQPLFQSQSEVSYQYLPHSGSTPEVPLELGSAIERDARVKSYPDRRVRQGVQEIPRHQSGIWSTPRVDGDAGLGGKAE
jgi:hypothetical protein